MQDQIKDEWIEPTAWAINPAAHGPSWNIALAQARDALAAVAPLIRAEAEAEIERLRGFIAAKDETIDHLTAEAEKRRADLAQARAQATEEAARVADTFGESFAAQSIAEAIRALAPPAVAEKGSK